MPPPGATPAAPPVAAPSGPVDPHQLGVATSRLGASARRNGKVAFAVASVALEPGEVVEAVVQGRFQGEPGVAVLAGNRILVVNDAQWKPAVESVGIDSGLVVQGWQDDKSASLLFQSGDQAVTIEAIGDRALAQEMAGRVRAKIAEAG